MFKKCVQLYQKNDSYVRFWRYEPIWFLVRATDPLIFESSVFLQAGNAHCDFDGWKATSSFRGSFGLTFSKKSVLFVPCGYFIPWRFPWKEMNH